MLKKILIGVPVLALVLATIGWFNREAIVLHIAANSGKIEDIAPYKAVEWQQGPEESVGGDRPPNIIFILADDLGINDISTFGGGAAGGNVKTPNIDALAASGAVFSQAYAGSSTCAPSRAMIVTGRYPTRTGFEFTPIPTGAPRIIAMFDNAEDRLHPTIYHDAEYDNAPAFREQGLPSSEVTVAEVLKDAGYHTVHIGKWHLGEGEEFGANAQGFDESLLMSSGLFLPIDHPDVVNERLEHSSLDRFLWARLQFATQFNDGPYFEPGGYLTDYWTDESIRVIEANKNRPFFLYLAHWGVHTPLQATREDYNRFAHIEDHRTRVYAAMIHAVDRSVGRIVEALEREGLTENTLIVFSSDNGGAAYVGLEDLNAPYRGWKATFFEGGVRVPLFMKWPSQIDPGTTINGPAGHIDIMPTLASAAGANLPQDVEIDGVDLIPFAMGNANRERPHETMFWQTAYYRVVRHGDWKLQVSDRPDKTWLFDLASDPTEQTNLSAARPDKVAELQALLDEHAAGVREPLYPHYLEIPLPVDKTQVEEIAADDEYIYFPN